MYSAVMNTQGHVISKLVYINPTVPYGSKKHICAVLFSVFVAVFLYLPPLLLLILYPTRLYRKISHNIKSKWRIAIKTYVETFQGCYKDGTNGTRDYRALSGYKLALASLLLAVQSVSYNTQFVGLPVLVSIIVFTVFIILCSLLQPYKHRVGNASAVTLLAIMTAIFALSRSFNTPRGSDIIRVMTLVLLVSPHCALCGYVVWKLRCCRKYRNTDYVERSLLLSRSIVTASSDSSLDDK